MWVCVVVLDWNQPRRLPKNGEVNIGETKGSRNNTFPKLAAKLFLHTPGLCVCVCYVLGGGECGV